MIWLLVPGVLLIGGALWFIGFMPGRNRVLDYGVGPLIATVAILGGVMLCLAAAGVSL